MLAFLKGMWQILNICITSKLVFHNTVCDVNYKRSATYYELFCIRQKREKQAQQAKVSEFM